MKKLLITVAVVLVAGGLAGGLSVLAFGMEKDTGPVTETLDVKAGEPFRIRLETNPSTGYMWEAVFAQEYLELLSTDIEDLEPGKMGAPGVEVFVFRALKEGTVELQFTYKRPWETQVLETRTYTASIKGEVPGEMVRHPPTRSGKGI